MVKVLGDLGIDVHAQSDRIIHVLNKTDLLERDDERFTSLQNMFPEGVFASALSGDGVDRLLANLDQILGKPELLLRIDFKPVDGAARAWLYQNAMVKSSKFDECGHEQVLVSIDPANHARLRARWPKLSMKM